MILTYRDLDVWKNSMSLVEYTYETTLLFPKEEIYGLTSQIRRASVSVPSNIAEGFMRKNTREYLQFLYIALGSLGELDTQLEIAKRLSYVVDTEKFNIDITLVRKQLYSLINTLKQRLK